MTHVDCEKNSLICARQSARERPGIAAGNRT